MSNEFERSSSLAPYIIRNTDRNLRGNRKLQIVRTKATRVKNCIAETGGFT